MTTRDNFPLFDSKEGSKLHRVCGKTPELDSAFKLLYESIRIYLRIPRVVSVFGIVLTSLKRTHYTHRSRADEFHNLDE